MFSQPWSAWPRAEERRGVIFAWERVDMAFCATDMNLLRVAKSKKQLLSLDLELFAQRNGMTMKRWCLLIGRETILPECLWKLLRITELGSNWACQHS